MDDQRGLGHVMDVNLTKHRCAYTIKNAIKAYVDLYMTDPKLWTRTTYLSLEPFTEKIKDLFWIGTEDSYYLAVKFPFAITVTNQSHDDGTLIVQTPAERLLSNSIDEYLSKLNIFLKPLAYGQVITDMFEIKDFIPKATVREIVVFDLFKEAINLEEFLQRNQQPSDNVYTFWKTAFISLRMIHTKKMKIGRTGAINVFSVNEAIRWMDSSYCDKLNPSEPLVNNFKRLLDINRLLLENSFVRSMSQNSQTPHALHYEIYKITQTNVPELENVIFFTRDFLLIDDFTMSDWHAKIKHNKRAYTDSDLTNYIKFIYGRPNQPLSPDIPIFEKFIANVKAIDFDNVFQYLTTKLDVYLQKVQVILLKSSTQHRESDNYAPWTFKDQQLFIITSTGEKLGPIFRNTLDRKLYVRHDTFMQPLPVMNGFYLETSKEGLGTKIKDPGTIITDPRTKFDYFQDTQQIAFVDRGLDIAVPTGMFNDEKVLTLYPKNSKTSNSFSHPDSRGFPRIMPIRPLELKPLELNTLFLITYDQHHTLGFKVNGQYSTFYELGYKINADRTFKFYYGNGNSFHAFQVPISSMTAYLYSKTDNSWTLLENTFLQFEFPFVYLFKNNRASGRINLLYEPHVIESL